MRADRAGNIATKADIKTDPSDLPLTRSGRVVVAALSAVAAVLGAVAIIRLQYAVTDPFAYTAGVAAFLA
ncbi:MAG TPA: hypothetical protein VNQ31_00015, partial [Sphingomonadaceae bacterium]|nr:hypothetical protein [Sphingomonadaceae bacterium]